MRSNLKYRQVAAAHTLQEHGVPLRVIAGHIYNRYGYKTPESCIRGLRNGLRIYGFTTRNFEKCSSCGLNADDLTPNCKTCKTRHLMRTKRAATRTTRGCSGCGCKLDNFVEGCEQCWSRRSSRQRRAAYRKAAKRL